MPASQRLSLHLRRLVALTGGMLVSPRRTLGEVAAGGAGGLTELLVLLGVQVLGLQLAALVRAVWFMAAVDPAGGLSSLVQIISQPLLMPLLAALGGSVLLGWFGGVGGAGGRNLDLAALAVVPSVVLQALAALAWSLIPGLLPLVRLQGLVLLLGGVWFLALLLVTLQLLRRGPVPGPTAPAGQGRRVVGWAALALLLLLLAGNAYAVVQARHRLRPVTPGGAAPALALPDLSGEQVSLDQQRGRVVLISFWATWCAPCKRELPFLERLQREHRAAGLTVLAVNVEGDRALVQQFLADRGAPAAGAGLTYLLDTGGAAARFGVQTLPHLVLLDRAGKVAHVQVGAGGEEVVSPLVARALNSVDVGNSPGAPRSAQ